MRRILTALTLSVSVLSLAACGGGGDKAATGDDKKKTTTTSGGDTSTTTADDPPIAAGAAPLTGLPAPAGLPARPALVVKIDNAPKARPQAGINQADIVIAEKVEDGITRLFAIFHSQDADPVGPVRSARTTDIHLVTPLARPLFSYSGTNTTFQKQIDAAPLVDIGIDKQPGLYNRRKDRPALYNLFSATPKLWATAPAGSTPPPPLLRYRPDGKPFDYAGVAPAKGVHLEYRGKNVTTLTDWVWDAGASAWVRTQDGTQHVDAAGGPVRARNVVVQFVEYVDTGQRDQSGSVVPEGRLIGAGEAWVLCDGKAVKGRWSKPSAEAPTTYTDSAGKPIGLTPGQTWIELPPPGSGSLT